MAVQLGMTELACYGIGPRTHLSVGMYRPVVEVNQQMVFGTKRPPLTTYAPTVCD